MLQKTQSPWQFVRRPRLMLRALRESREGHRASAAVRDVIPALADYPQRAARFRDQIAPPYQSYVTSVSSREMAASLELSVFLRVICDVLRPKRLLDTGSGFSSFILRSHRAQSDPAAEVWSVDDAPDWLEQTRRFLVGNGLSDENVVSWDDFAAGEQQPFDLILHDMGSMATRADTLAAVLGLCAPDGVVLLDDVHKPKYAAHARRVLAQHGFRYFSLWSFLRDELGRYSYLAIPGGSRL